MPECGPDGGPHDRQAHHGDRAPDTQLRPSRGVRTVVGFGRWRRVEDGRDRPERMCRSAHRDVSRPSCSIRAPPTGRPRSASLRPVPSGPREPRHGRSPPAPHRPGPRLAARDRCDRRLAVDPGGGAAGHPAVGPRARHGDDRTARPRHRHAHTPLIGLPGRIGIFPRQGSHPGPLSFICWRRSTGWPAPRLGASSWAAWPSTPPPSRSSSGSDIAGPGCSARSRSEPWPPLPCAATDSTC